MTITSRAVLDTILEVEPLCNYFGNRCFTPDFSNFYWTIFKSTGVELELAKMHQLNSTPTPLRVKSTPLQLHSGSASTPLQLYAPIVKSHSNSTPTPLRAYLNSTPTLCTNCKISLQLHSNSTPDLVQLYSNSTHQL